jgi:Vitamin K-dependent gamma-carboxylase
VTAAATPVGRWWFRPQPLAKVAVLRTIVGLYLPLDLYIRTSQVVPHSYGSSQLYDPVHALAYLHQSAPQPWLTQSLRVVIIALGILTAFGVWPRFLGWLLAFAYADWTCLAMSYGKVDHDHLAILVAVFVLPTVRGATWRSTDSNESAGWTLRCIEVAVIATYFLAAVTKVRIAGWHWASGAIFTWAIVRRGTWFSNPLLHHPHVLLVSQWALFCFELSTPIFLFVRQRWRTVGFVMFIGFHTITYLALGINFAPLIACLFVLLPLERLAGQLRAGAGTSSQAMASIVRTSTNSLRSAGVSGRANR